MVDLSVVLPAYNESRTISASLRRLTDYLESQEGRHGRWRSWEIIVVDDGSEDGTHRTARAAGDQRLTVQRLESNAGKGAAVGAGALAARGACIITTDVDLSYGLEDIGEAYEALARDERPMDMVTGDRRHPQSRMDLSLSALGHVVRRQTISSIFNLGVRLFYGLAWRDTQCGLKGFRREAAALILPRLRTRRFLADIEMFLIASRLGLKVGRIPVHLTHLSSDSSVRVVRQAPAVLADAIRIKLAQIGRRYDPDQ